MVVDDVNLPALRAVRQSINRGSGRLTGWIQNAFEICYSSGNRIWTIESIRTSTNWLLGGQGG